MIYSSRIPLLAALFFSTLLSRTTIAQPNTWAPKADFGGVPRANVVGFSIGDKGYIGTGTRLFLGIPHEVADFWQYDPTMDAWTQEATCPGGNRSFAVGFNIAGKGYIGTGRSGTSAKQDFWQYDPGANAWTHKADCGGLARFAAVGFSIGNKGYIALGMDTNYTALNDVREYDPPSDTWTPKANFAGSPRGYAVAFSIGTKGYVGTGGTLTTFLNDFWEYDPTNDAWTQKAGYDGNGRHNAVAFSIGDKGYTGTGQDQNNEYEDFSEYDPVGDTWTNKANFTGGMRAGATGFSIGNRGYIGVGRFPDLGLTSDFEEYQPDGPLGIDGSSVPDQQIDLYPTPANEIIYFTSPSAEGIEVFDAAGDRVFAGRMMQGPMHLDLTALSSGTYLVVLGNGQRTMHARFVKL